MTCYFTQTEVDFRQSCLTSPATRTDSEVSFRLTSFFNNG